MLTLALSTASHLGRELTSDHVAHIKNEHANVHRLGSSCAAEVSACAPLSDSISRGRCLIENFEKLSAPCQQAAQTISLHLPGALMASKMPIGDKPWFPTGEVRGCDAEHDVRPYVWSYHIHIQWAINDTSARASADAFGDKLMKQFQPHGVLKCNPFSFLTDLWNQASVPPDSPTLQEDHLYADMCDLGHFPPGGPFLHPNRGWTISPIQYHQMCAPEARPLFGAHAQRATVACAGCRG